MVATASAALVLLALCGGVLPASFAASVLGAGQLKHVVVCGAGFGGWGAVKSLLDAGGCRVTLVDTSDDPTGALGSWTPSGKPFDSGTRGFWMDYPNVYSLLQDELKLKLDDCFSPCTNSSFYSPAGLEATAPVFGASPILPSPLGQVLASARLFERLPVADRASVAGLLLAILDLTPETMAVWDKMTAQDLFERFGLSRRLVEDFLKPTLLVGLFKPPAELSAAVVMELLYFYALAHQTSFDVRWLKKGSVASTIFHPLHQHLSSRYGERLRVLPSSAVTSIGVVDSEEGGRGKRPRLAPTILYKSRPSPGSTSTSSSSSSGGGNLELTDVDGLVLAVGAKGLRGILQTSPALASAAPQLAAASTLGSIDCIAVRLWLDKKVPTRSPANVFASFPCLRGAGATFFCLDQLQPDEDFLWGGSGSGSGSGSASDSVSASGSASASAPDSGPSPGSSPRGSVLACDFYNAEALMSLSDGDLVRMLTHELLPGAVPAFGGAAVVDSHVVRYAGAVNHFSPGSFAKRPRTDVEGLAGVKVAGDFVWMGDREPLSKGLCQERAYVSGIEAAAALAKELGLPGAAAIKALPVRPDEPQVQAGRAVSKVVTDVLLGLPLAGGLLSRLLWPARQGLLGVAALGLGLGLLSGKPEPAAAAEAAASAPASVAAPAPAPAPAPQTARQALIRGTESFLTNPVLEALRKADQLEEDLPTGNAATTKTFLLLPIVELGSDLDAVASCLQGAQQTAPGQCLADSAELLRQPRFSTKGMKSAFNKYSDNIFYSDSRQANLYLGGGTLPDSRQTQQYLLRNSVMSGVEFVRGDVEALAEAQAKGASASSSASPSSSASSSFAQDVTDALSDLDEARAALGKYFALADPDDLAKARAVSASGSASGSDKGKGSARR